MSGTTAAEPGISVGVDVVLVEDVVRSLEHHGERFVARVFTAHEQASCTGPTPVRARHLAARFAAKEAVIKLLRPEGAPPDWRSIEVRRQASGSCTVELSGTAARLAAERGLGPIAVSLSHEGPVAVSVVLATADGTPAVEATAAAAS